MAAVRKKKNEELPLIVIVGPTASGKTALGIELAQRYKGEIICADSRTLYKGMDIGTAKPTKYEQAQVPHWGLDICQPGERFTAADFKCYAEDKIVDIRRRGKLPFLVGGSGLYIDSVLFNYQFSSEHDSALRQKLEELSLTELYEYCYKNNIQLPENKKNKRHVVAAIARHGQVPQRSETVLANTIVVGIATDATVRRSRIAQRVDVMLEQGVVKEALALSERYGWESEAMTGNVYRLIRHSIEGGHSIDWLREKMQTRDWQLAKRQLTWFRRNRFIHWAAPEHIAQYIDAQLAQDG